MSGGVEIYLDVVGRPPEICLEICPVGVQWVLIVPVASVIDIGTRLPHCPPAWQTQSCRGGAQRRTGNGAQASISGRQRVCGQPRSPLYRRGHAHAVAYGDATPATSFNWCPKQIQYPKSICQVRILISEGGNPLLPQSERFCGVGQGQELMLTLTYLSPLKFAGGSMKPTLG